MRIRCGEKSLGQARIFGEFDKEDLAHDCKALLSPILVTQTGEVIPEADGFQGRARCKSVAKFRQGASCFVCVFRSGIDQTLIADPTRLNIAQKPIGAEESPDLGVGVDSDFYPVPTFVGRVSIDATV